MPKFKKLEVEV